MAGNGESAQLQENKRKDEYRTIAAEEAQPLYREAAEQPAVAVRQVQNRSAYSSFFNSLRPLPPLPVAPAAPTQEKVGYKERRRRSKEIDRQRDEYKAFGKELSREPRLVSADEVRRLPLFQTREGRRKWSGEVLPHSSLTREETMKKILDEGDYSNFENLDLVMRNVVASRALSKFMTDYHVDKNSDPEAICAQIKSSGAGVSALLDPGLRLGLSLAQRGSAFSPEMKRFFLQLDEAMSTAVMVETLTSVADENAVSRYFRGKGAADPDGDAEKAAAANRAQQIQIAKRLLLMQLSDFRKITKANPNGEPWDKSMAVALSHCSRVVLTTPRQDRGASDSLQQQRMWRAITLTNGGNPARDDSRACSTHSVARRRVGSSGVGSEEKKRIANPIGQYGMNCAIGGLGHAGVSGKTICNDGSCGHFYSMHKEADETHYGAMLMGIESDAAGVMNQMGHTHDIHATPEKASSLGGQRTDEVGEKYGGRQCDLSGMSAANISQWLEALERKMLDWQSGGPGMQAQDAAAAMRLLAGKKMNAAGWAHLRGLLGLTDAMPVGH